MVKKLIAKMAVRTFCEAFSVCDNKLDTLLSKRTFWCDGRREAIKIVNFIQNGSQIHKNHTFSPKSSKFHIFHPKSTGFASGRAFCGLKAPKLIIFLPKSTGFASGRAFCWLGAPELMTFLIQNRPDLLAGVHFLQNLQNLIEICPKWSVFASGRAFPWC